MLARYTSRGLSVHGRWFSSSATRHTKVAVLGAGGGIGQPLSLLLKADPLVTSLSLYDIRGAPGVAADVSHVDTAGEVGSLLVLFQLLVIEVVPGQWLPRRQTRRGSRRRQGCRNPCWRSSKGTIASFRETRVATNSVFSL